MVLELTKLSRNVRLLMVIAMCVVLVGAVSCAQEEQDDLFLQQSPPLRADADDTSPSLSWQGIITALSCIALLAVLTFDIMSCSVAMFGLTVFLWILGIINATDALAGLSNTSVVTVQLLVVMIAPIAKLPLLKILLRKYLQTAQGSSEFWTIVKINFKLCIVCYAVSWFVGNIPTTAMLTPLIQQYCIENHISSSQILIPMQVATLIGGTFSKIGVSTTMLVSGLMEREGLGTIGFFETIKVSGFPSLFAIVYLSLAPRFLLPRHVKNVVENLKATASSFMGEFALLTTSPLVGKTVVELRADLTLRHVDVVQLIPHNAPSVAPPPDDAVLNAGDVVILTGEAKVLEAVARWLHLEWQTGSNNSQQPESPMHNNSPELSNTATHNNRTLGNASFLPSAGEAMLRASMGGGNNRTFGSMTMARRSMPNATRLSLAPMDDALDSQSPTDGGEITMAEVVLSPDAVIAGRPTESLRSRYRMAILSLRRRGTNYSASQVSSSLTTYHGGDTMLLLGPRSRFQHLERRGDFLVVTYLSDPQQSGFTASEPDMYGDIYVAVPLRFPIGEFVLTDGFGDVEIPKRRVNPYRQSVSEGSPLLTTVTSDPEVGDAAVAAALTQATSPLSPIASCGPQLPTRRFRKVVRIPRWYPYLTLFIFAAAIGASIAGQDLVLCCAVAVGAMLVLGLRRLEDVYKSLKLDVFIIMAFSFGIGSGMTKSGLSPYLAAKIADSDISGWSLKFVVSLASSGMSNIISSKAAAQVLLPVVVDLCQRRQEDPLPTIAVLAVSIIQSLITPYSHASGLIVMGPGGYTSVDFYKFGAPINIILCALVATAAQAAY